MAGASAGSPGAAPERSQLAVEPVPAVEGPGLRLGHAGDRGDESDGRLDWSRVATSDGLLSARIRKIRAVETFPLSNLRPQWLV